MKQSNKPDLECSAAANTDFKRSDCAETEHLYQAAKLMARQQLEVSSDSPFNLPEGLSFDNLEKARLLSEETDEIKKQLDLVQNRLKDLNQARENSPPKVDEPSNRPTESPSRDANKCDERKHFDLNQQATSSTSQFHPDNRARNLDGRSTNRLNTEQTRTRPLTGKADCPNCECDKRRQSICDSCASPQQPVVRSTAETCLRRPSFISGEEHKSNKSPECGTIEVKTTRRVDHDGQPTNGNIDYHNKGLQTSNQPIQVQREVVPNQIFAIGKSLNDKRVQLAKAIDDLQLMMDRVKKRSERLDQERKVAQLYKEQWRFGPTIGGCTSVRNSLSPGRAKPNYKSRLDPQLTRDSNSLMGFQHIEPSMKSRHFGSCSSSLNIRQPAKTPQPKPRYSKMAKMPSVAQQNATTNRLAKSKELSNHHVRSKSLDSLQHVDRIVITGRQANPSTKPRVINHKEDERQVSTVREPRPQAVSDYETRGTEEELEEEIDDGQAIAASRDSEDNGNEVRETDAQNSSERQNGEGFNQPENPARKMSWVPVFGETEIKTVDRRQPSRKTLVLNGRPSGAEQRPPDSILRQQTSSNLSRASAMKQRSYSAVNSGSRNGHGDGVMNEATKKLKFANNLLEREKCDSRSRNQLIVCNKLRPPPTHPTRLRSETQSSFRSMSGQSYRSIKDKQKPIRATSHELSSGANQDIERLRAKIDEQQRILSQMSTRSSSCCCGQPHHGRPLSSPLRQTRSKSVASHRSTRSHEVDVPSRDARHELVNHLKEQLAKTRSRLAKMLEEERVKHQLLENRVHSSLRRQTDLRAENEILRQSLNRCIDTCLRDISSTFESLSETLSESAFSNGMDKSSESSPNEHGDSELTDVAQLIVNNRHLRQMRNHIESIESQRRSLFEELSNEKLRSKQLELQLIESKLVCDQLIESNKKIERELLDCKTRNHNELNHFRVNPQPLTSEEQLEIGANTHTSSVSEALDTSQQQSQADLPDKVTDGCDEHLTPTTSTTFDSIDVYRQYIQSMTPDFETIRRERRMVLDEFDNIKKMLATMNE